jgi:hypothetical protein
VPTHPDRTRNEDYSASLHAGIRIQIVSLQLATSVKRSRGDIDAFCKATVASLEVEYSVAMELSYMASGVRVPSSISAAVSLLDGQLEGSRAEAPGIRLWTATSAP